MRTKQILLLGLLLTGGLAHAEPVPTWTVGGSAPGGRYAAEATLEATRQAVMAAQVPGQVVALPVRAGDVVRKGQLLLRLDGTAAQQNARASQAMVGAAQAQLTLAQRDYQRQQQLFASGYISQSAMDRATAQYQAARAQAQAQNAQASAAGASAGNYTLLAPYNGRVIGVNVKQGDMAMPGQPLLTVYDPGAFRVVANVPQSILPSLQTDLSARLELQDGTGHPVWLHPVQVTVAPGADPVSHTVEVRLDLAGGEKVLVPGSFVRAWFVQHGRAQSTLLRIPARAVVVRSELTAVYVMKNNRAQLRQVRLGKTEGDSLEVVAGLSAGEVIALDPLSAARQTTGE